MQKVTLVLVSFKVNWTKISVYIIIINSVNHTINARRLMKVKLIN
jgi:hypothetical protein